LGFILGLNPKSKIQNPKSNDEYKNFLGDKHPVVNKNGNK
jgi:hypothetical protein